MCIVRQHCKQSGGTSWIDPLVFLIRNCIKKRKLNKMLTNQHVFLIYVVFVLVYSKLQFLYLNAILIYLVSTFCDVTQWEWTGALWGLLHGCTEPSCKDVKLHVSCLYTKLLVLEILGVIYFFWLNVRCCSVLFLMVKLMFSKASTWTGLVAQEIHVNCL